MKPLKLEFSGLNSYRDRQTVDFEQLGKGGLFGIFGPTGSGKSSILDAVTLALYGKVDRADRNFRGIINMKERSAEVTFSFELGGVRYLVQRRYDRVKGDPEGARAASARLITMDGVVLADQVRTVNERLAQIIGLTYDEFSKAVVLPQGKFSQFLGLQGADRAEMLGHILRLNRFGDPLYAGAKARAAHWENEAKGAMLRQRDLGDCGDEAVAKAEDDSRAKKAALCDAERELAKTRSSLEEAASVKKLDDQLRNARSRRMSMEADRSSVERDRAALEVARRAVPLMGAIDAVRRLTIAQDNAERELATASTSLVAAQSALLTAEGELRLARERQESQEPLLTAKKTRLEDARSSVAELENLVVRAGRADAEATRLVAQVTREKAAVQSLQADADRLSGDVESLSAKQRELAVDPLRRDSVQKALQTLADLHNAETEDKSCKDEFCKRSAASLKARSKVIAICGRLPGIAASRYYFGDDGALVEGPAQTTASDEAEEIRGLSAMSDEALHEHVLGVADKEIDLATALREEASERVRLALIHEQAAVLASELREGQPCPVCGSEHHPCVAAGDAREHARAKAALTTIEECLKVLQAWRKNLHTAVSDWDNCMANRSEALAKAKDKEAHAQETLKRFLLAAKGALGDPFNAESARKDIQDVRDRIAACDKEHAAVSRALADAMKRDGTARKQLEDARGRLGELEAQSRAVAAEAAMLHGQVQAQRAKVHEMTGGEDPSGGIAVINAAIRDLRDKVRIAEASETTRRKETETLGEKVTGLRSALAQIEGELGRNAETLARGLSEAGFESRQAAEQAMLSDSAAKALELRIEEYRRNVSQVDGQIRQLEEQLGGRTHSESEYAELEARVKRLESAVRTLSQEAALAEQLHRDLLVKRARWGELERGKREAEKQRDVASRLANLVRGKAFVKFLAEEHLRDMATDASARLGSLTGQRYVLEIADGTDFVIRDDFNGGERRSVATLSGGETFLTSLALALALSSKVQLRGQYPLGFFFLDEGFGTLDDSKLEAVIGALERLHDKDRMVGVISHVKELKERLHYYLEVTASADDGSGSKVVARVG